MLGLGDEEVSNELKQGTARHEQMVLRTLLSMKALSLHDHTTVVGDRSQIRTCYHRVTRCQRIHSPATFAFASTDTWPL